MGSDLIRNATRPRVLAAVLGLLALVALLGAVPATGAAPAGAAAGGQRVVLNDVHTDVVHVEYDGGALRLRTRAGSPPYEFHEPGDVVFQLKDIDQQSRFPVPDLPEYAFLGNPGDPVWIAPEYAVEGLLYAGWDTESILPGVLLGDEVQLSLVEVSGPGRVELFWYQEGVPARMLSGTDQEFRTLRQDVSAHRHANWAFTALGRYDLTFEVRATAADGTPLAPARATYAWYVGGTQAGDVPADPTPTGTPTASPTDSPTGSPTTGPTTSPPASPTTGAPTTGPPTSAPPSSSPPSSSPPPTGTVPTSDSPAPSCAPTTVTSTSTGTSTATVLSQGHVDYAARLTAGGLVSQIKDGTVAGRTTWRDPADVVLHVKPAGATTVPAGNFGFLGATGSKIWQIPQTQNSSMLWLGWNTEQIAASAVRGPLTWSLDKVEGPGKLVVYLFETFGQPRVVFNSGDGLPDRYTVPTGTHAHGNWAFTKEGAYKLTFTHRATLANGRSVGDTAVVTFAVGGTDPNALARRSTSRTYTYTGNSCGGPLALTGTSIVGPVALGAGLLVAGGLVVALTYRRRRSS